jgi:hypothetical protein
LTVLVIIITATTTISISCKNIYGKIDDINVNNDAVNYSIRELRFTSSSAFRQAVIINNSSGSSKTLCMHKWHLMWQQQRIYFISAQGRSYCVL